MKQYRIETPTGARTHEIAGFEVLFGALTLLNEADCSIAAYAPGEWLRIEPIDHTDSKAKQILDQQPEKIQKPSRKQPRPPAAPSKRISERDPEAEALAACYQLLNKLAAERRVRLAKEKEAEKVRTNAQPVTKNKERREVLAKVYSIILSDDWGKEEE